MLDSLPSDPSFHTTVTDIDVTGPVDRIRVRKGLLRRVGGSVPRAWLPAVRRGLTRVSAHLPITLRNRLHRLAGAMSREMGLIEQTYAGWIDQYDRMDDPTHHAIMARVAAMPCPPLISVVMPVYNPDPEMLSAAIQSVQAQFYPWWELCIADDASTDPAVIRVLEDARASDPRLKLVRRERNGHISEASNSALRLATGAFVALLDHDDLLPPHALHEVALRIIGQPDIDIIYSDEDHVGVDGQRHHPYFKPDWDPDLLLGQNLISHFGVYRRSLVDAIGGFRPGYEGSQDHDLALRAAARSRPDRIVHIPRVLYHWRQSLTDRTFSTNETDRCVLNARRAVQDVLPPGARAVPASNLSMWTRVHWPLPSPAPLVSAIIDARGSPGLLTKCLEGLLGTTRYDALEVLVLGAPSLAPADLGHDQRVRFLPDVPVNEAAAMAHGSLLLLLDAGLLPLTSDWLTEMASQALRSDVGAVGARLLSPDGIVLHAGIALAGRDIAHFPFAGRKAGDQGYFGQLQLVRSVSAVSAACLVVRRPLFLEVAGLDEAGLSGPLRDIDFCLKLRQKGYRTVWTPYAALQRVAGPTYPAPAQQPKSVRLLYHRWGQELERDPYWSPNLSTAPGELGLAFPPRGQTMPMQRAA